MNSPEKRKKCNEYNKTNKQDTLLAVGVGPSRPRLGLVLGSDSPQAQPTKKYK